LGSCRIPLASREAALIWVNTSQLFLVELIIMSRVHELPEKWLPISIAPSDVDLEVCVMDKFGIHALVFPVHKNGNKWIDAVTKVGVDIQPTHWRKWTERH
jgi:hypothetical protein